MPVSQLGVAEAGSCHAVRGVGRIGIERLLDGVLGLELVVGVRQADTDAVGVGEQAVVRDAAGLGDLLWMRDSKAVSTLMVALTLETCTAGTSPKKFGKV